MSAEVENLLEGMGSTVGGLQSHHNLTANETRRLNKILENYEDNTAVSASAYFVLIVSYSILIAIGSGGNLMVLAAVATNKCKCKFTFWNEFEICTMVQQWYDGLNQAS